MIYVSGMAGGTGEGWAVTVKAVARWPFQQFSPRRVASGDRRENEKRRQLAYRDFGFAAAQNAMAEQMDRDIMDLLTPPKEPGAPRKVGLR